jgi:Heterokaryon incompatibility protein (HET)
MPLGPPKQLSLEGEYRYSTISHNQIRLLVVHEGDENDPVECSLRTATLARDGEPQKPEYEALSYYWGRGDPTQKFFLRPSTQAFYVRPNLYTALKRFRREKESLVMWIDALCIDQNNNEEKNTQVSRMADIYSKAKNVCIWLGDGEEACNMAMDFIPDIINLSELDRIVADPLMLSKWFAFADLLKSRWFSRRWVIQELGLARKATVHYGTKEVNWIDFADAIAHFVTKLDSIEHMSHSATNFTGRLRSLRNARAFGANVLVEATSSMFRKSDEGDILERLASLEYLVSALTLFETSDARDTLFALLSIAKDRAESLSAEYQKDVVEIYKDFVAYCIKSSGSLDIICRPWALNVKNKPVGQNNPSVRAQAMDLQRIELPSWVLQVTDSAFGTPEDSLNGRKNADSLVGLPNRKCYNAAGDRKAEYFFRQINASKGPADSASNDVPEDSGDDEDLPPSKRLRRPPTYQLQLPRQAKWALHVRGFRLGKITKRSAPCVEGIVMNECLQMGGWDDEANLTVPDRLWRTLVADRGPDGHNPPCWYRRACVHSLANVTNNGNLNTRELIAAPTQADLMKCYLERVQCVTWNRRFVQDEKQGLFGVSPAAAEVGDLICILFGCSVPVILREQAMGTDKYFKFIGESYMHSKMDGGACGSLEEGQIETFELR